MVVVEHDVQWVARTGGRVGPEHMTNAVLDITLLIPDDWQVLRAMRLRALRDAPRAFAADHSIERGWTEAQWRERLGRQTWVLARADSEVVGIACMTADADGAGAVFVESVWVPPEQRRRGVLRSMIEALAERAARAGSAVLLLWVMEDNVEALVAYQSVGFVPTGERQELAPGRFEVRLSRRLRPSANGLPAQRTE